MNLLFIACSAIAHENDAFQRAVAVNSERKRLQMALMYA